MAVHNRGFVLAAEWLYEQYREEWREIDKRWPHFENDPVITKLRFSARQNLRRWVVENLPGSAGGYLIPI